jgi:hypothetical protein
MPTAGSEERKRKFVSRLQLNLSNTDPRAQDRMVDEFRDIILRAEVGQGHTLRAGS